MSLIALLLVLLIATPALAQPYTPAPDRVLTRLADRDLPQDQGAAGLYQRLLKLRTTASAMHTTAHPDDEHAGLLSLLSRGQGVRLALATLNRGEAGANAIGPELFDALGLIRTEELLLSGRYYGLDDQYFTSLTDYGYSKTLDESIANWGRETVLEELVRIIRINRPLVVISRFHGSERDGHGNHQAAGGITPDAVRLAGDPTAFPEQISQEGLRPWTVRKLYRGGIRESERWNVTVDPGAVSPWLGETYNNFGYHGLSLQKSQTSGRSRVSFGPALSYYERLDAPAAGAEAGFFDGLDVTLSGLFDLTGEPAEDGARDALRAAAGRIDEAVRRFNVADPSGVVEPLAQAARTIRQLIANLDDDSEAAFMLRIKARQIEDAVQAALGLRLEAIAMPAATQVSASPWAPLPTMGAAVPGQALRVDVQLVNPTTIPVRLHTLSLDGGPGWQAEAPDAAGAALVGNKPVAQTFTTTVPPDGAVSRPYFARPSIAQNRYSVTETPDRTLPASRSALLVVAAYEVFGVPFRLVETVSTRESRLPEGYVMRELSVVPTFSVQSAPASRMVPLTGQVAPFDVRIEVQNNQPSAASGELRLAMPAGWRAEPAAHPVALGKDGERAAFTFTVMPDQLQARSYTLEATLESEGRTYTEGYDVVTRPAWETRYLYRPAVVDVRGVDVRMTEGLAVGYVMGVGDEVPSAIEQLGGSVTLLEEADLAGGDLSGYDAIVVGTRAYAVRADLIANNRRLLDFAREGGHLVVLYQTPEYRPEDQAPFPASLPQNAEEVSEEDAAVTILAPDHPVFAGPNRITPADFDGWIEQRGSKFFASWDPAYTPLIRSNDAGQPPQDGGWLTAQYGSGRFTYFAYAIHRQAPFNVPGAYRVFANLLSLGQ
ncbi:MAG: PIG-L family deacetylase [Rhodothermales bacterium]|nr:PIG-L family deacetylase [Rhodothermales bacterium]